MALAAGFKGKSAQTLRTTVLVVVVLTVLLFGGTTARMLEVLGIRTGVEDDAASSSEEEDPPVGRNAWFARRSNNVSAAGRWSRYGYVDDEPSYLPASNSNNSQTSFPRGGPARVGIPYQPRSYNHQAQAPVLTPQSPIGTNAIFSAASSESFDDSDIGEVLPLEPTAISDSSLTHPPREQGTGAILSGAGIGEDGKWFQALDERYLLPLFSNATASRTFHARRARRNASGVGGSGSALGTPGGSEDEEDDEQEVDLGPVNSTTVGVDESRLERGLPSPMLRSSSSNDNRLSSS